MGEAFEALHAVADSLLSYILPLAEGECVGNLWALHQASVEWLGVRSKEASNFWYLDVSPCGAARAACQAGACAAFDVCSCTHAAAAAGCRAVRRCGQHAEGCRIVASTACAHCTHALNQVLPYCSPIYVLLSLTLPASDVIVDVV